MTTTAWQPPRPRTAARPRGAAPATRRRLRRALRRCRRPLAAVLLACATAVVVATALPGQGPAGGVQVLVATTDLPVGSAVAAGSRAAVLPPTAVPSGALAPADVGGAGRASGARLAAPVREGEVITDVRLRGDDVLASLAPGQVAVPVTLTTPVPDGLVVPGARVAVLAASPEGPSAPAEDGDAALRPSGVLVSSAAVLVVSTDPLTTGLLSGGGGGTSVVLALDDADAARVAAATANGGVVLARAA